MAMTIWAMGELLPAVAGVNSSLPCASPDGH